MLTPESSSDYCLINTLNVLEVVQIIEGNDFVIMEGNYLLGNMSKGSVFSATYLQVRSTASHGELYFLQANYI